MDTDIQMDNYDETLVPAAFGLQNTGAICYLNSFLQALAGCTAMVRAMKTHRDYLQRTRTGAAMVAFFEAEDKTPHSNLILQALVQDLAERRPRVRFGAGQESASEALHHLLEMMEPPATQVSPPAATQVSPPAEPAATQVSFAIAEPAAQVSPITRLFQSRHRITTHCQACHAETSNETDLSVMLNLFHISASCADPARFSAEMMSQTSVIDAYPCPKCNVTGPAYRHYRLTMTPEILFCAFNIYGDRPRRYYPSAISFPAIGGGTLTYLQVGQIEHSGSLAGGHYWARGVRADGVYLLNDMHASPGSFVATHSTYIVVYHVCA